ncbi:hypothetical protein [Pseudomonas sp. PL-6]
MNARVHQFANSEATQAAQAAKQELSRMRSDVNRHARAIISAGFGLRAIGDLLGADASEHFVDRDMEHGLAHAVVAIGELLNQTGGCLWDISSEEDQQ